MGMKILIEIFFSLKKDSRTGGHEATLVKDQCRLDIREYSYGFLARLPSGPLPWIAILLNLVKYATYYILLIICSNNLS